MTIATTKGLVLAAVIAGAGGARAGERTFAVVPELTYATQYMYHGFNLGENHPTWQPSLTLDRLLPGFSLKAWMNSPVDKDYDQFTQADFLAMATHDFVTARELTINLHGYVDYWSFPEYEPEPGNGDLSGWQFHVGASLPDLISIGRIPLIPSYNYYYWTPDSRGDFEAGGQHELFLLLPVPCDLLALRTPPFQTLNLGASLNVHEGFWGVKSGLSHATAHLSTSFDWKGIHITPSLNYQWSFEDSLDPEDEFWATLSASYRF